MTRQLIIAAAVLLVVTPIAITLAASSPGANTRTIPPAEFLTAGKTYTFGIGAGELQMEVLAKPSDGWVKVNAKEEGVDASAAIWVNLQQVSYISTKQLCTTCKPTTSQSPAVEYRPSGPLK